MNLLRMVCRRTPAIAAALLLAGCATGYRVDSAVHAFSVLEQRPQEAGYRFERLPSQQAEAAAGQTELEALAEPALARAGLHRDDQAARYTVQVAARSRRVLDEPYIPFGGVGGWGRGGRWGGWGGWGGWPGRYGYGYGYGFGLGYGWAGWAPATRVQTEVSLLLRDGAGGKVVYETHAVHDGWLPGQPATLSAMFDAALRDFPQSARGMRSVQIAPAPPSAPAPGPAQAPRP